ncbi:MAG: RNA polymerase sigma factor [Candidatus Tectimicrobiota bacterium]
MRRVAARDRQAFELLYQRYYTRLSGYVAKFLQRRELVEEVLNDVMLVVWSRAERFNYTSRLSTWIFGIAYNKILQTLRDHTPPTPEETAQAAAMLAPEAPDEAWKRHELRQSLGRALQTLSVEQRSAIELTFYYGFSCQEIADIMQCPVNTVKTRLFHARKRLEPLLANEGFGVQALRSATKDTPHA